MLYWIRSEKQSDKIKKGNTSSSSKPLFYKVFSRAQRPKKNLQMRVEAENGATEGKTELAKKAKALGLDAIHDTVHEMARDEARHGKAFKGLLERYFKDWT